MHLLESNLNKQCLPTNNVKSRILYIRSLRLANVYVLLLSLLLSLFKAKKKTYLSGQHIGLSHKRIVVWLPVGNNPTNDNVWLLNMELCAHPLLTVFGI